MYNKTYQHIFKKNKCLKILGPDSSFKQRKKTGSAIDK